MFSQSGIYALAIVLSVPLVGAQNAGSHEPELVAVRSGDVSLRALVWRPAGTGPFPAVLLNHGSGRTREELERLGPSERAGRSRSGRCLPSAATSCMYLFRRGVGLSADQGVSSVDLMNREADGTRRDGSQRAAASSCSKTEKPSTLARRSSSCAHSSERRPTRRRARSATRSEVL